MRGEGKLEIPVTSVSHASARRLNPFAHQTSARSLLRLPVCPLSFKLTG